MDNTRGILLVICVVTGLNMQLIFAVRHGRNLIWAQTDEGRSGISRIVSIDGDPDRWVPNRTATTRYITAPSEKWHFAGLSYDYKRQNIYWSDTGNKKIQGFLLNGTNSPFTIFDGISSGVGSLAMDWLTGNIYWADSLYNWILMAPAIADTRLFRVVVNTDLDQPMGLVVHPFNGLLFWSDWGAVAKIERSDTQGQNRRTLVQSGLVAPMGLVLDMAEERLYWVDRDRGAIESIDIFGKERKIHFTIQDTQFVSIALYHDYMFVTDQQDKLLYAFNRKSGKHEVNFSMGSAIPSSVIMYDSEPQKQPGDDANCDVMACDHMCVSTYGGRPQCICASGYELQADGKTCVDDGKYPTPMFVYSIGNALCRFPGNLPDMTLNGITLDTQCFLTDRKSVLALTANVRENTVYFAENTTKTISKVKLAHGESPEIIIGGTGVVEGLAVDWVTSNLYWTDSSLRKILVAKSDGRYQRVLHEDALDRPRGLVVDAKNRWLFWADVGARPRIERSFLDGGTRTVFVSDLGTPNHLCIDYRSNRLFWTDSGHRHISSVDFEGKDRKLVLEESNGNYFGITLFQDFLIWTETGVSNGIHAGIKDTGEKIRGIVHPGVGIATDVITFDVSVQPLSNGPCDAYHGCQQLCLPSNSSESKSCACAMGFQRSLDGTACVTDPWYDNFLLFADTYQKQIYQMDIRSGDFKAIALSGHDNPISVDFDPAERKLYWSDVSSKVIKRALLNGSEEEIVKLMSPDSVPDGLAIDPVSKLLFYTDAGNQIIAVMTLTQKYHVTLIRKNLHKPRAIAVDPVRGYMYWSDWSAHSGIERASMDGTRRKMIVDTGATGWPNGLTLDTKGARIVWCDARTERIESADLDGRNRRLLYEDSRAHFFGMTDVDGVFFYTDWTKKTIMKLENVGTGYSSTAIGQSVFARANDIHAYKFKSGNRGMDLNACSVRNGKCSHVCLPTPEGRVCACPDGVALLNDSLSCNITRNGIRPPELPVTTYSSPTEPRISIRTPAAFTPKEKDDLVLYQPESANSSSHTTSTSPTPVVQNIKPTHTPGVHRTTLIPWWFSFQPPRPTRRPTPKYNSSSGNVAVKYPSSTTAHVHPTQEITHTTSDSSHLISDTLPTSTPTTSSWPTDHVTDDAHFTTVTITQLLPEVTSVNLNSVDGSNFVHKTADRERPTFPLFDPNKTPSPTPENLNPDEHSPDNRLNNSSTVYIFDHPISYVGLSGILAAGVVVMVIIAIMAFVLYKKFSPRKSSRDIGEDAAAVSSHIPNFHATYEMPLQDAVTSSHTSAEHLAGLGDSYFLGEDDQGVENPSFIRRDSGNTIYEEIPQELGSPTFTTFVKSGKNTDSQFDYLTDDYSMSNGNPHMTDHYAHVQRNYNVHTVTAHVHTPAHLDAADHGNYHVIHAKKLPEEESSLSGGVISNQSAIEPQGPPVPEKRKLRTSDDVYATISRSKGPVASSVGRIAAIIEQQHIFHKGGNH